jgi:hypothetical protein
MPTYYVRTGGNNSHDGSVDDDAHAFATPAPALLLVVSGDTIHIAGSIAIGNATVELPNGVNLVGSGVDTAEITSLAALLTKGCIVKPGNGSVISDLTIRGLLVLSEDLATYQAAVGFNTNLAVPQARFTSTTLARLKFRCSSDGIFLLEDGGTNLPCVITGTDIDATSGYDLINILGDPTWKNCLVDIDRFTFAISGANGVGNWRGATTAAPGSQIRLRNGTLSVIGDLADPQLYTTAIGAVGGNIQVTNSTLTVSGRAGFTFAKYQADGGIAQFSRVTSMTTETFIASTTWTCPVGVTSVVAACIGGGSAGNGDGSTLKGGGGGAYAAGTVVTVPGNNYTVTVGAGGLHVDLGIGGAGGDSWFSTNATVKAKGGSIAGTGGLASASVGTTKFNGGTGANGDTETGTAGGGGGSSAGPASAGNNGVAGSGITGGAGGAAVTGGGAGGAGGSNIGSGVSATQVGGGGGGDGGNGTAGDGFRGQVSLTYTVVTATVRSRISSSMGLQL